eukprot:1684875-Amphidinium_carterae.1
MPRLRLKSSISDVEPKAFAPGIPRLRSNYGLTIPRLRSSCANSHRMWMAVRRWQCPAQSSVFRHVSIGLTP